MLLRKVSGFPLICLIFCKSPIDNPLTEMIIRVRGSRVVMKAPPLKYILIVAKPKEHYLESSKATGAIQLQNKISDRRDCGGDSKAILSPNNVQEF